MIREAIQPKVARIKSSTGNFSLWRWRGKTCQSHDRAARRKDGKGRGDEEKPAPATGWRAKLGQFQENLQKQVEQAQKEAAKRGSDRKR